MRLLPRSLFWRLMLALCGGLIIAQVFSAAINLVERDRLLLQVSGMRRAQRIADIVKLLDSSNLQERRRIVRILDVPPLYVSLDRAPVPEDARPGGARASVFSAMLHLALGDDRPIRVVLSRVRPPDEFRPDPHERMMSRMYRRYRPPPMRQFFMTQVRLRDGTWVTFDSALPEAAKSLPWRLALTLLVLLVSVLALSYFAVRWLTRPLNVLASAADELGQDINRPPLTEEGPLEVKRAAQAFNRMQARLSRFIEDRTRMLAAMSHDLKTPITRMRLRAELLEDQEARDRFEQDLMQMEAMVTQTLDFMKGLDKQQPMQPIDIMALLESLQSDYQEMGRDIRIEGRAAKPCLGVPALLRRAIANLLDNAVAYGKRATIVVEEGAQALLIRIRDEGPGLPEAELEKVFEPFYRLEASRSRETGGSGLGLAIARNIARTLGGDLALRNRAQGGLEAILRLPLAGV